MASPKKETSFFSYYRVPDLERTFNLPNPFMAKRRMQASVYNHHEEEKSTLSMFVFPTLLEQPNTSRKGRVSGKTVMDEAGCKPNIGGVSKRSKCRGIRHLSLKHASSVSPTDNGLKMVNEDVQVTSSVNKQGIVFTSPSAIAASHGTATSPPSDEKRSYRIDAKPEPVLSKKTMERKHHQIIPFIQTKAILDRTFNPLLSAALGTAVLASILFYGMETLSPIWQERWWHLHGLPGGSHMGTIQVECASPTAPSIGFNAFLCRASALLGGLLASSVLATLDVQTWVKTKPMIAFVLSAMATHAVIAGIRYRTIDQSGGKRHNGSVTPRLIHFGGFNSMVFILLSLQAVAALDVDVEIGQPPSLQERAQEAAGMAVGVLNAAALHGVQNGILQDRPTPPSQRRLIIISRVLTVFMIGAAGAYGLLVTDDALPKWVLYTTYIILFDVTICLLLVAWGLRHIGWPGCLMALVLNTLIFVVTPQSAARSGPFFAALSTVVVVYSRDISRCAEQFSRDPFRFLRGPEPPPEQGRNHAA